MSRGPQNPLRPLLGEERQRLTPLSRSQAAPASQGARAKAVLAVADGDSYAAATRTAGRRSGDAVAALVARFNTAGLAAGVPGPGGGRPPQYTAAEREQMLATARRGPDRERDGTAVGSLSTRQRALRKSGLPQISTYTSRPVLIEAGLSGPNNRSGCATGRARRRRKRAGQNLVVTVTDPDAAAKKSGSRRPTGKAHAWGWGEGGRMRPGRTKPFRSRALAGKRGRRLLGTPMSTSEAAGPSYCRYFTRRAGR